MRDGINTCMPCCSLSMERRGADKKEKEEKQGTRSAPSDDSKVLVSLCQLQSRIRTTRFRPDMMDISAMWERQARELTQAEDTNEAQQALLAHLTGLALTPHQREALQSLSPAAQSILSIEAGPLLATKADALIRNLLLDLHTSSHLRNDAAAGVLAEVCQVYQRWQDCQQILGR
jgi:hypothetical protein